MMYDPNSGFKLSKSLGIPVNQLGLVKDPRLQKYFTTTATTSNATVLPLTPSSPNFKELPLPPQPQLFKRKTSSKKNVSSTGKHTKATSSHSRSIKKLCPQSNNVLSPSNNLIDLIRSHTCSEKGNIALPTAKLGHGDSLKNLISQHAIYSKPTVASSPEKFSIAKENKTLKENLNLEIAILSKGGVVGASEVVSTQLGSDHSILTSHSEDGLFQKTEILSKSASKIDKTPNISMDSIKLEDTKVPFSSFGKKMETINSGSKRFKMKITPSKRVSNLVKEAETIKLLSPLKVNPEKMVFEEINLTEDSHKELDIQLVYSKTANDDLVLSSQVTNQFPSTVENDLNPILPTLDKKYLHPQATVSTDKKLTASEAENDDIEILFEKKLPFPLELVFPVKHIKKEVDHAIIRKHSAVVDLCQKDSSVVEICGNDSSVVDLCRKDSSVVDLCTTDEEDNFAFNKFAISNFDTKSDNAAINFEAISHPDKTSTVVTSVPCVIEVIKPKNASVIVADKVLDYEKMEFDDTMPAGSQIANKVTENPVILIKSTEEPLKDECFRSSSDNKRTVVCDAALVAESKTTETHFSENNHFSSTEAKPSIILHSSSIVGIPSSDEDRNLKTSCAKVENLALNILSKDIPQKSESSHELCAVVPKKNIHFNLIEIIPSVSIEQTEKNESATLNLSNITKSLSKTVSTPDSFLRVEDEDLVSRDSKNANDCLLTSMDETSIIIEPTALDENANSQIETLEKLNLENNCNPVSDLNLVSNDLQLSSSSSVDTVVIPYLKNETPKDSNDFKADGNTDFDNQIDFENIPTFKNSLNSLVDDKDISYNVQETVIASQDNLISKSNLEIKEDNLKSDESVVLELNDTGVLVYHGNQLCSMAVLELNEVDISPENSPEQNEIEINNRDHNEVKINNPNHIEVESDNPDHNKVEINSPEHYENSVPNSEKSREFNNECLANKTTAEETIVAIEDADEFQVSSGALELYSQEMMSEDFVAETYYDEVVVEDEASVELEPISEILNIKSPTVEQNIESEFSHGATANSISLDEIEVAKAKSSTDIITPQASHKVMNTTLEVTFKDDHSDKSHSRIEPDLEKVNVHDKICQEEIIKEPIPGKPRRTVIKNKRSEIHISSDESEEECLPPIFDSYAQDQDEKQSKLGKLTISQLLEDIAEEAKIDKKIENAEASLNCSFAHEKVELKLEELMTDDEPLYANRITQKVKGLKVFDSSKAFAYLDMHHLPYLKQNMLKDPSTSLELKLNELDVHKFLYNLRMQKMRSIKRNEINEKNLESLLLFLWKTLGMHHEVGTVKNAKSTFEMLIKRLNLKWAPSISNIVDSLLNLGVSIDVQCPIIELFETAKVNLQNNVFDIKNFEISKNTFQRNTCQDEILLINLNAVIDSISFCLKFDLYNVSELSTIILILFWLSLDSLVISKKLLKIKIKCSIIKALNNIPVEDWLATLEVLTESLSALSGSHELTLFLVRNLGQDGRENELQRLVAFRAIQKFLRVKEVVKNQVTIRLLLSCLRSNPISHQMDYHLLYTVISLVAIIVGNEISIKDKPLLKQMCTLLMRTTSRIVDTYINPENSEVKNLMVLLKSKWSIVSNSVGDSKPTMFGRMSDLK